MAIGAGAADTTEVAARLAAVCDMIEEHRKSGAPICAARSAAIAAMIDDVAAAAAEEWPTTTTGGRKKRLVNSYTACSYDEVGGDDDDGELGVGLSGFVVKARLRATGEYVAVKSLHSEPGGGTVWRLLREACFMAACSGHPSLVALRGVAIMDGDDSHSLVMDYVGPNLLYVLRARGQPFPEADVRRIMRQLIAGAAAMHRHGIVHRDIKSENVLVSGGVGGVKICDLGSAKSTAERSPPATIAGTMEYMAPEVLSKSAVGHGAPADAWSLGCVMAELLTGEPPFRGEDVADQLREIFGVLGVPEESVWEAMRPRVSAVVAAEVKQWRARQRQTTTRQWNRLREVISGEVLSDEGFEVLEGLLTCDPGKRMTAAAALRCAWFTDEVDYACLPAAAITSVGCGMSLAMSMTA